MIQWWSITCQNQACQSIEWYASVKKKFVFSFPISMLAHSFAILVRRVLLIKGTFRWWSKKWFYVLIDYPKFGFTFSRKLKFMRCLKWCFGVT